MSSPSIEERARAYGMQTMVVDGNDVLSVFVAAKAAADNARNESEPVFLECLTYKMKGHGVYDKGDYRPKEEVAKWLERDPIKLFRNRIIDQKVITQAEIEEAERATQREVEESVEFAMQGAPLPFDEIKNYVYAEGD
jgi:pyruvate dehydrogenase E1 component alpha subunit